MLIDGITDAEYATLKAHGWIRTASGRYAHPQLPLGEGQRRRLYTPGEALTLTAAMDQTCPDCGSEECPGAGAGTTFEVRQDDDGTSIELRTREHGA